jgi:hypothetical protein
MIANRCHTGQAPAQIKTHVTDAGIEGRTNQKFVRRTIGQEVLWVETKNQKAPSAETRGATAEHRPLPLRAARGTTATRRRVPFQHAMYPRRDK